MNTNYNIWEMLRARIVHASRVTLAFFTTCHARVLASMYCPSQHSLCSWRFGWGLVAEPRNERLTVRRMGTRSVLPSFPFFSRLRRRPQNPSKTASHAGYSQQKQTNPLDMSSSTTDSLELSIALISGVPPLIVCASISAPCSSSN